MRFFKGIALLLLIPLTVSLNVNAATALIDGRFITPATIDLTTKVNNTLPAINGGSGINAYTTGDTLFSSSTNTLSKLSGNVTTIPKMLMQTGTGTLSAAPFWTQPTLNNILAPTSAFSFGNQNLGTIGNLTAQNLTSTGNVTTGGINFKAFIPYITTISNTYTIPTSATSTYFGFYCDTTSSSFTITLPVANFTSGYVFVIYKKIAANTLTIATSSSQTINGATTQTLTAQYSSLMLQSDGSSWFILSRI